jgi:hypothetical protein
MKIAVLHHQYGSKYQKQSLKLLKKIFSVFGDDCHIVVSDPLFDGESYLIDEKTLIISCSNQNQEFSGWQRSFDFIKKQEFEAIVFTNDTITYNRYIDFEEIQKIRKGLTFIAGKVEPILLGNLDLIRAKPPYIFDCKEPLYSSTYFFCLNKAGFNSINRVCYFSSIKLFFNNDDKRDTVLLKKFKHIEYFEFIEKWLYLPNSGFKWHLHDKLNCFNHKRMTRKFQTILNEHWLSQNFIIGGGTLLDFNTFKSNLCSFQVYFRKFFSKVFHARLIILRSLNKIFQNFKCTARK